MDDCVAQNTTLHDLKADLAALFGDLDKVITALEDRNQVMAPVWKNASDEWNDLNLNRSAAANDSLLTIDNNPTTTVAPTTTTAGPTTTAGREYTNQSWDSSHNSAKYDFLEKVEGLKSFCKKFAKTHQSSFKSRVITGLGFGISC